MFDKNELSISIIVPSLNQGRFIDQTLDSILKQNYPDIEVIVVDGGSTDGTVEILKSYNMRIKWVSEKDNGQTEAINKGLRLASGEILGYLNSDDYLLAGSLDKIRDQFLNEKVYWISGDALIVDENSIEIQKGVRLYKNLLRWLSMHSLFFITNYLVQPSTFWSRRAFKQAGFFDENLHYSMDYDYWFRLYRHSRPKILKDALSAFRIHSSSKGGSNYTKQIEEELNLIKRHTKNKLLLFLHEVHSSVVIFLYRFLKDRHFKKQSEKLKEEPETSQTTPRP
jgi:glycosyltransferase involved in cell wall biosynthesis